MGGGGGGGGERRCREEEDREEEEGREREREMERRREAAAWGRTYLGGRVVVPGRQRHAAPKLNAFSYLFVYSLLL